VGVAGSQAEVYVTSVLAHDTHSTHEVHGAPTQHEGHASHNAHSAHETQVASEVHADAHEAIALPHNLPTFGYDALFASDVVGEKEEDVQLGLLENTAHTHKVLLSSDAMRYFVQHVGSYAEQKEVFDAILKKARVSYPSEEGWVALDQARMEQVIDSVKEKHIPVVVETNTELENSVSYKPMTAGSLAEAIVTKNVVAAYRLMANRPMVALADATSDLEGVLRVRKGEDVVISNLLKEQTDTLSTDTLESLILALTSALDGTYTTEEEAVKMAILKAIQTLK
jgi:hypothetical protein